MTPDELSAKRHSLMDARHEPRALFQDRELRYLRGAEREASLLADAFAAGQPFSGAFRMLLLDRAGLLGASKFSLFWAVDVLTTEDGNNKGYSSVTVAPGISTVLYQKAERVYFVAGQEMQHVDVQIITLDSAGRLTLLPQRAAGRDWLQMLKPVAARVLKED